MTMLPFRGKCRTCGHDHDAEDVRLRDVLATIAAPPPAERAAGPTTRTLPPLDGLVSAWGWFVTDHQNGGHADDCAPYEQMGCHCGFDNLRRVIEGLAAAEAPR